MNYQLKHSIKNLDTDKKWLKRNGYNKLAIKLYGLLHKSPRDLSDTALTATLKTYLKAYKEAKRQLVYSGLLEIHKINAGTIVMVLGDIAITSYSKTIVKKEHSRLARKTWEYLELSEPIEEDDTTNILYDSIALENLKKTIPQPAPIPPISVL